jgi:hypothetical protein
LLFCPQQCIDNTRQGIVWYGFCWFYGKHDFHLGALPIAGPRPPIENWSFVAYICSVAFCWAIVRPDSTTAVHIANPHRIGAALTDRLSSSTAWRYVFLGYVVAMAIPIIFVSVRLPMYKKVVGNYLNSRDLVVHAPQNLLYRILPVIDLTLTMGATVCFELALYQGALRGWYQSQVISLFAAGSGGCLTILLIKQWFPAYKYNYWRYSYRGKSRRHVLTLLLSFSWGASYYTLIHYMRKFKFSDIIIKADAI